jgi:VanZ family protein
MNYVRQRPPGRIAAFLRYRLPAIVWTTLLLAASTAILSSGRTGSGIATLLAYLLDLRLSFMQLVVANWVFRKTAHLVCYGIEGWLMLRAVRGERAGRDWRWVAAALTLTFLVAALDEGNQSRSPSRTGSINDVAVDMIGAALAVVLFGRSGGSAAGSTAGSTGSTTGSTGSTTGSSGSAGTNAL